MAQPAWRDPALPRPKGRGRHEAARGRGRARPGPAESRPPRASSGPRTGSARLPRAPRTMRSEPSAGWRGSVLLLLLALGSARVLAQEAEDELGELARSFPAEEENHTESRRQSPAAAFHRGNKVMLRRGDPPLQVANPWWALCKRGAVCWAWLWLWAAQGPLSPGSGDPGPSSAQCMEHGGGWVSLGRSP